MDSILADQLEWLISGNMEGPRFKRQIMLLVGCLADGIIPEDIQEEVSKLTKRIACEEVFQALLEPLNAHLRQCKDKENTALDIGGLISQVESSRVELNQCEPANMALLVTWLLSRARERKLIGKIRGPR